MELKKIDISLIKPVSAPTNSLQQKSLLNVGQKQPIRVRKIEGEYQYLVTDGRRRLADIALSGGKTILAIVENVSDVQAHLDALVLNSGKTNFMDEANHLKILKNKFKYTNKQLSELVNYSVTKIVNLLSLTDLIPEFQFLMLKGELKQSGGKHLAKLPHTLQREIFEQLEGNLTVDQCKQYLNEYKAKELANAIEYPKFDLQELPGLFIDGDIMVSLVVNKKVVEFKWNSVTIKLRVDE
jgi:ParB/RepB/Spo0J family partition protein